HSLTRIHITPASILVMSSERRHIDAPGAGSSCTPVISSEERDTERAPSRETLCHLQCQRSIRHPEVMAQPDPSTHLTLVITSDRRSRGSAFVSVCEHPCPPVYRLITPPPPTPSG